MKHFWTNTIWYILLGVISLVELLFTIYKAKNRRLTVAFFITVFGITLNFETMVLIFLKAYTYYPKILQSVPNPFDDVLAGNLFSQFSISASLLLVTVLDLKYYWYFIFAILYSIIEELFLALGIYSQKWYQTWMTVVTLPCFFWLVKYMYGKIIRGIKPIFYYGYIFLGLFALNVITVTWGFMLAGIMNASVSVLADPINSKYFIVVSYFLLVSISLMLIYFLRLKLRWKALIIIMHYVLYYEGYQSNLILIKDGWFPVVSTMTIFWMYFSIFLLDRLYGGPSEKTLVNDNRKRIQ